MGGLRLPENTGNQAACSIVEQTPPPPQFFVLLVPHLATFLYYHLLYIRWPSDKANHSCENAL